MVFVEAPTFTKRVLKLLDDESYAELHWEQGRRKPTGPAKVLLKIAARHPEVVLETAK